MEAVTAQEPIRYLVEESGRRMVRLRRLWLRVGKHPQQTETV